MKRQAAVPGSVISPFTLLFSKKHNQQLLCVNNNVALAFRPHKARLYSQHPQLTCSDPSTLFHLHPGRRLGWVSIGPDISSYQSSNDDFPHHFHLPHGRVHTLPRKPNRLYSSRRSSFHLVSFVATSTTTISGPQTFYSTLTVHHSCKSQEQSSQAGSAKPDSTPSGILDYLNSALVTLDVTSVTAAGSGHASHSTRTTHSSHKACSSHKSHSIHSTHNSHSAHTTQPHHTVSPIQMICATRTITYHPSLQTHASSSTTTISDGVAAGSQSHFNSSTSLHSSSSISRAEDHNISDPVALRVCLSTSNNEPSDSHQHCPACNLELRSDHTLEEYCPYYILHYSPSCPNCSSITSHRKSCEQLLVVEEKSQGDPPSATAVTFAAGLASVI